MRCTVFALFLSAGTWAFGQAGPASPLTPEQPGQLGQMGQAPSLWSALSRDFGKMTPQQWNGLSSLRTRTVLLPPAKTLVPLGDASIDRQMVLHPSAKDLGAQPPGTQVAQDQFPGLTFQPIDGQQSAPTTGPLSTRWPRLDVHRMPTDWQTLKMGTVGGVQRLW